MGNRTAYAFIFLTLARCGSCQVASPDSQAAVFGPYPGEEVPAPPPVTAEDALLDLKRMLPEVSTGLETRGAQIQANSIIFERKGAEAAKITGEKTSLFLSGSRAGLLSADGESGTLVFEAPTAVDSDLSLKGPVTSDGITEWSLWSLNTFDSYPLEGFWTPQEFSTCGASTDYFLGGPCKFGATRATGTYLNLPAHSEVMIKGRVHYFDQWTGQSVYMKLGNTIVWTGSHNWCPKGFPQDCAKHGIDACGHPYPDTLSRALEVTVPHSAPFLALTFSSTIADGSNACTASWGIDDIAVYLR